MVLCSILFLHVPFFPIFFPLEGECVFNSFRHVPFSMLFPCSQCLPCSPPHDVVESCSKLNSSSPNCARNFSIRGRYNKSNPYRAARIAAYTHVYIILAHIPHTPFESKVLSQMPIQFVYDQGQNKS